MRPANSRQFMPPRKSIPIATTVITANAPKSGSRSSRPPVSSMTKNIGMKPRFRLCMKAALRTV